MTATPKGLAKRDVIASAAARVLVADGLEAVTHRAVAEAARVPLGSTTYHFSGLDDLRRAAADRIADADIARMAGLIADLDHRRRSADAVARIVVQAVVPAGAHELVTWYERYARAARAPVLAAAARRTNLAAIDTVDAVLRASYRAHSVAAPVVLAVVDGAVLGALADSASPSAARQRAADLLAGLLRRLG